jgi:hypothetical protein
VAHPGVRDLDQHLAFLGWSDIDLDNLQGLASLKGHGGTGFHEKDSLDGAENGLGRFTAV